LWKDRAASERAELVFRVAEGLRRRKFEFNAGWCWRVGKNWDEPKPIPVKPSTSVNLYARATLHLDEAEPVVQLQGRDPSLHPWSGRGEFSLEFPSGDYGGYDVAAVACGNTVVLKPSSDSPTSQPVFRAFRRSRMPPGW